MKSDSAYEISWELVASAIIRRKYLGDKALEEMTDDQYGLTVMITNEERLGKEARRSGYAANKDRKNLIAAWN